MITVKGSFAGGKGGGVRGVGCVFSQGRSWEKTSVQTFSNRFLEALTEGDVPTEARRLFQYFTTLTENDRRRTLHPEIALSPRGHEEAWKHSLWEP